MFSHPSIGGQFAMRYKSTLNGFIDRARIRSTSSRIEADTYTTSLQNLADAVGNGTTSADPRTSMRGRKGRGLAAWLADFLTLGFAHAGCVHHAAPEYMEHLRQPEDQINR